MTSATPERLVFLKLDADELASCVACGLCLPHCPTYRVTGEEAASPRGRIAGVRAIQDFGLAADESFVESMESCIQCRGCETACPSGVPFGRLMEGTREALAEQGVITPRWLRLGLSALGHHRLLVTGSRLLAVAQRLRLVPKRAGLPWLPLRVAPLPATGTDVWFLAGCVMDAWQRDVHRDASAVLAAAGVGVQMPAVGGCCGALHSHAGLASTARALAERTMASMQGSAPIVIDSAGCGAAMKDYGHLVGTPASAAFAARVVDIHEFLAARIESLPVAVSGSGTRPKVIVQDPCHLRHVQKTHLAVRTVLARYVDVVELDDEGLCCGAGGAYSTLRPEMANDVRDRKLASISRASAGSGATLVASGNPGCSMHLIAGGATVQHPMEIVATALRLRKAAR
jgi:glycolate oxidase iron-sulfur subunit